MTASPLSSLSFPAPPRMVYNHLFMMLQGRNETSKRRNGSLVVKREQHPPVRQNILESVKGYLTNISYGLEGFKLSYFRHERQKEAASAFVLGSEIREESSLQLHQELVWLTYRKNIAITASLHSDVGWGCLIRVAQMAWAHSLQRHFKLTHRPVEKNYVVTAFLEGEGVEFKYGLWRFMEMGARLWQMKPGHWYTMTQAATTLQALHQSSPLKGSQHLVIKVFNETVNVKQLLEVFGAECCSCVFKRANCIICHQPRHIPKQSYFQKEVARVHHHHGHLKAKEQSKKHIMLIITTRLGSHSIEKQNFAALLQLMSLPIFNGCLGGLPQKARFLTGRHQDKISYLDPHYVEQSVDQLHLAQHMELFRCREVRYMQREELHPEMALCFYLQSRNDLQALLEAVDRTQLVKGPFLKYDWDAGDEFEVLGEDEGRGLGLKERFEDLEESMSELNRSSQGINSSFLME